MKNSFIILSLLFLTAFLLNSCDSDGSTGNSGNEDNSNYFPNNDGAYYKYNVNRTDSDGVQISGTRSVNYDGNGTKAGTPYQRQIDSSTIGIFIIVSESYFRKTGTGVYYFLDTTGFASNIPPGYQYLIPQLVIDPEMILLTTPPQNDWPVFKILLANLSILNVKATNLGKETISSGAVSGEALKVKYDVTIAIPALPVQTLTAFCWFVPNVGAAKWEGNATVINALSGGGIDFGDSTTVVTQDLIFYSLNQ
ncbi:MAG: hypothetical protein ACM34O_06475 [Ignavibacteria bacterium]